MLGSVDLSDYMLHDPVKIHANEDLFDAIHLIIEHRVSGICVVDDQEMLVGVLSEMDCLSAILAATYNEAGDVGKAREYMTANVDVCDVHADLVDVADDMLKKGHRRRPVLDHGRLVGQITCRQLLRVISEFNQNRIAAH
ncbi:CBS domain-containing protein [Porticoccaceae bacterium]|jgi:CBS domain-containing protein|nr:CBS domain-containing protein [Porticoccaceae bacterium]MCT2534015.1 CBS domain-containing protein [SAR92 clade bacterium H231]MDA8978643.1 CBS domain-containing protein [bacterium]MBT6320196.1 CBS domain-containing protein [Porticoccaceae bacterium]MBT7258996.1 CBS domain-containing protein [Porticoccaceae bacterium]